VSRSSSLRAYYAQAREYAKARHIDLREARGSPAFRRAYAAGRVPEAVQRIQSLRSYYQETRKAAKGRGVTLQQLHSSKAPGGELARRWSDDYRLAKRGGLSPYRTFLRDRQKHHAPSPRGGRSVNVARWNALAKRWQKDHNLPTLNSAKSDPRFKKAFQKLKKASQRESAALRGGKSLQRAAAMIAVYEALYNIGWITREEYERYIAELGL